MRASPISTARCRLPWRRSRSPSFPPSRWSSSAKREPATRPADVVGDHTAALARRAGAGAIVARGEGLVLAVALGADGARGGRGVDAAADSVPALARGYSRRGRCGAASPGIPRLPEATSAPRRSSTGCCGAMACRRRALRSWGYMDAQAGRRRADPHGGGCRILFTTLLVFLQLAPSA